jgi:hypothetical protein
MVTAMGVMDIVMGVITMDTVMEVKVIQREMPIWKVHISECLKMLLF